MEDFHYNIDRGLDGGGDEYEYLYWTTEPPTKYGWYWCRVKAGTVGFNIVLRYPLDDTTNTHLITHWLGPLPEPEAPK